jgi:G3E family GTPase
MKRERWPVILLTGFLGSGKTTLLNSLLRDPAMAGTAVLVNEFGEVGIDHALIQQACGDVVLLENGCICCTVREGLAAALLELADKRDDGTAPPFERVVIETTGLADPIPIMKLLVDDADVSHRYGLLQVLTVADATCGMVSLDAQPEALAQVAPSDCVWISKADLASPNQVAALQARMELLAPGASVLSSASATDRGLLLLACSESLAAAPVERRLGWARLAQAEHGIDCTCCPRRPLLTALPHVRVHSQSVVRSAPLRWDVLGPWLEMLMQTCGSDILRLKGIVCIEGEEEAPWAIHGVQGHLCAPERLSAWPGADRRSRLVFILRNGADDASAAAGPDDIGRSLAEFEARQGIATADLVFDSSEAA